MSPEYGNVAAKKTKKPIFVILVFSCSVTLFGCTMELRKNFHCFQLYLILVYKTTIFGKDLPWMPPLVGPGFKFLIFDFIWVTSKTFFTSFSLSM